MHEFINTCQSNIVTNLMFFLQIGLALDVVDRMCKSSSDVPIESFHPIIHACEQRCELHMVRHKLGGIQSRFTCHATYQDMFWSHRSEKPVISRCTALLDILYTLSICEGVSEYLNKIQQA